MGVTAQLSLPQPLVRGSREPRKRILFVHNHLSSFVRIDRELLADKYEITDHHERSIFSLRPFTLRRLVAAHDLVFCWFASWHSIGPILLARQMRKPSILVTGGYDTANLPEASYGSQRGGLRKLIAGTAIRSASRLITNSEAAKKEAVAHARADVEKITVIHHGVEPLPLGPLKGRERVALTVGNVWRENLLRKGLLPFVQAAAHLPEVKFVHAGRWCDSSIAELRQIAPPNVEFVGFLPDEELRRLYARASVYVQPSLHEAFGMSVAEAMTAGCIPVVTRNGSLPEVVGDAGVYMSSTNSREVANAIAQALTLSPESRVKARTRIMQQFSVNRRQEAFNALLHSFVG